MMKLEAENECYGRDGSTLNRAEGSYSMGVEDAQPTTNTLTNQSM
jgi:hypothetical protein